MRVSAVQADRNLTISRLAQGARVLTCDPDRVLALFRESGVIDDPGHRRSKSALDTGGHLMPEREPVPRTLVEERVQALCVPVRQSCRQRPGTFAFAI